MTDRQKSRLQAEWNSQFDAFAAAVGRMAGGDREALALLGMFYDEESDEDAVRGMRSALASVSATRLPNGRWRLEARLGQCGTFFASHREIGADLTAADARHLAFGAGGPGRLAPHAVYWHRRMAESGSAAAAARLSYLKQKAGQRRRAAMKRRLSVGCWVAVVGTIVFLLVASVVAKVFF